jgi:hypothetical protein
MSARSTSRKLRLRAKLLSRPPPAVGTPVVGAPPLKKVSKALPGLPMEGNDWPGPSALTQMPRPVAVEEKASPLPIWRAMKRSMEMPPGGPRSCAAPGWVLSFTVSVAC